MAEMPDVAYRVSISIHALRKESDLAVSPCMSR